MVLLTNFRTSNDQLKSESGLSPLLNHERLRFLAISAGPGKIPTDCCWQLTWPMAGGCRSNAPDGITDPGITLRVEAGCDREDRPQGVKLAEQKIAPFSLVHAHVKIVSATRYETPGVIYCLNESVTQRSIPLTGPPATMALLNWRLNCLTELSMHADVTVQSVSGKAPSSDPFLYRELRLLVAKTN